MSDLKITRKRTSSSFSRQGDENLKINERKRFKTDQSATTTVQHHIIRDCLLYTSDAADE